MASVRVFSVRISFCFAVFLLPAVADDWPQWNGPSRDGVLKESGIIETIPANGLPLLWGQPVSLGYSGPAVADGRVFVTDYVLTSGTIANNPGSRDKLQGTERVQCFDAESGQPLWTREYDCPYAVSYGSGPRTTPTVHDGLVYSLGAEGNLNCIQAASGDILWQKSFSDAYGAETPLWGHSAAPLVYRDSLICMVGGSGSLVVAFERRTGAEQWRSLTARETGYCPPTLIHAGGTDQLLIWDPVKLHSINPLNGDEYWQHPLKPGYGMSILPPIVEDNLMFVSGESSISAMYRLDDEKPGAKVIWKGKPKSSVYLATAGAIFADGHIYGSDTRSGALVCARATDGKRLWQTTQPTSGGDNLRGRSHGSAFLIRTDSNYLIFSDTGDFISANLSPRGYEETGRFHAIDPTEELKRHKVVWTYPAISDGRLYIRNGKRLVCYDVRRNE